MIPVVVRDLAEADVKKAKAWYAREDQRLGARFPEEFARTVDRIGMLPDQFPEVGDGVRRALLHHFRMPRISFVVRTSRSSSRLFINTSDLAAGNLGQDSNPPLNPTLSRPRSQRPRSWLRSTSMTSAAPGRSMSPAEVANVSAHGFWLFVGARELFVARPALPLVS